MVNLLETYPIDNSSKNLLDIYKLEEPEPTPENALNLARKQISSKYPQMPQWMMEALLKASPKEGSPMLESAARGVSNVSNYIPAIAGGFMQGASLPIRGAAELIPTEFMQKLASSPDLRNYFVSPETEGQEAAQLGGEVVGAIGPFAKIFQGLKAAGQAASIPNKLASPLALGSAGAISTQGDEFDRAEGALGALGAGAAGKAAQKVASTVNPVIKGLLSEAKPEHLAQSIQKSHDILDRTQNELYGQVRNAIQKRDIKIPISEGLLDSAREFFPKTTSSVKDLFQKAREGDYDAIHRIQSSLYRKGTKDLSNDDLVIANRGEDILDLRSKINSDLDKHLVEEGHLDISHVLKQAKDVFSKLKNTYYPKNLRKGVQKLVNPETRLIPKDMIELFEEDSAPMRKFLEAHPEASKILGELKNKTRAHELIKKLFLGSGIGGGAFAGGKAVYDTFLK